MKRIVVFGSITYDRTLHLPRLPHAGQGVMATAVTHSVGGKGANVSVAAARAGAHVELVSAVGGDGDRALKELADAGVDIHRRIRTSCRRTRRRPGRPPSQIYSVGRKTQNGSRGA